jgi:hypothetical protein
MYFILNSDKDKVLYFFETFEDLDKNYPYRKFTKDNEGYWGYSVSEYEKHYFINYSCFQTDKYKKDFPIPPRGVRLCTKYLMKQKRKRVVEKLLQ